MFWQRKNGVWGDGRRKRENRGGRENERELADTLARVLKESEPQKSLLKKGEFFKMVISC